MDRIYRRKLLKMAIAAPLAFSLALVLDIDPGLCFISPLMVFNTIWLLPDPIGLKRVLVLKSLPFLISMIFTGAFVAGLWGINSIVLFFFILLAGWGIQFWMPSILNLGILSAGMFVVISVLNSSQPYTTAVYMSLLLIIGFGLGWLVDRLFWPIFARQNIERQISQTFGIFKSFSDRAFHRPDLISSEGDSSLATLTARAENSMGATNKALKMAAMTGGLAPSDRDLWAQALALQARLLAHLLAISRLLQDNRENPLLYELAPELSGLGQSLSATFAGLSVTIVSKHFALQLTSPRSALQPWQTKLNSMRTAGTTRSFDLPSRLTVGLIEHRLEGLVTDTSKVLSWLEISRSAVPDDLSIALEPTQ